MTMLPDIPETDWDEYQRQQVQQQIADKISGFGLTQAINDKISGLQSMAAPPPEPEPPPPPPPPPPPSPPPEPAPAPTDISPPQPATDLSRLGGWATEPGPASAPTPPPEPEPTPQAPPMGMPTPTPESPSAAFQASQPESTAPPAPSTFAPPQASAGLDDWKDQIWQQGVGAVAQAGGDVQGFANNLWDNLQSAATSNDAFSAGLGAAHTAGANLQSFANTFNPDEPPPPPQQQQQVQADGSTPGASGASGTTTAASVGGVPGWLSDLIAQNAPPELASDPDFIRTVAAGAKAESGWDVNRIQNGYELGKGGGARGLFQFDMGGMGAKYQGNEQALLGDQGAQLQASQIVPLYAKAYASAPQGLSGAEKASWVAAQAERPYQYDNPQSAARRNYASAYSDIGGAGAQGGASTNELLSRTGSWTPPAAQAGAGTAMNQSQFGDKQLSADEAYAACGPAAAVRFAQMYGRNPSLREATDLASSVGWTSGSGMAGLGSEKALMDKMGVSTRQVGADTKAMAAEAQTGNPVTISTPGHYFFADGYDPTTGAFHVGQSGLDLRGGSEWMTPAQMESRMGKIQGALFADHPTVPAPSLADQASNGAEWLGKQKDAILSSFGYSPPEQQPAIVAHSSNDPQVQALDQAVDQSTIVAHQPTVDDTSVQPDVQPTPAEQPQNPVDRLKSAFGDFLDSVGGSKDAAVQALSQAPNLDPTTAILKAGIAASPDAQEIAGAAGQSAQQRLEDIRAPDSDLPVLGGIGDIAGAGARLVGDVTNELMPTTQLSRVYEGLSGDIRRDPEYNALMQQLSDQQGQLYSAGSGTEQAAVRQQMLQTQAAIDARKQEVFGDTGVNDLESAYRRGLASPDRANVEAIASLPAMVAGVGLGGEAAPTAARVAGRLLDPASLALSGLGSAAGDLMRARQATGAGEDALRQAAAIDPRLAVRLGGGAAGGLAGNASTPDDASPQERALRIAGGTVAGLGAAEAGIRGAPKLLYQRAAPSATGDAKLDQVVNMMRKQDEDPGILNSIADRIAGGLGLGGRTGDLDKSVSDKFAYINQMTGRARQAMGSAFGPSMDAEAATATYAGRGGRALQRVQQDLQPAADLVRSGVDDTENLNVYRKLMRDKEVADMYGGTRMSSAGITGSADAQARLNSLESHVGPDRWNKITTADGMLNRAQANMLLDRADAGLISHDLATKLISEHPHYNPTVVMKYLDEAHQGASAGGQDLQVTGNLMRRLAEEGSADATEQPLRSLTRHFVQNEVLVNRNQVARSILRAAQADPSLIDPTTGKSTVQKINAMRKVTGPEVSGPGGTPMSKLLGGPTGIASVMERRFGDIPGTMSVYEGGQRNYYKIPEGLEHAVKGLDAGQAGVVEKVLKTMNAPLRWGATAASPPFLVTNALADAVTTYIREGAKTTAGIPRGWYDAAKQNGLYQDYIKAGGGMESLFQRSPQDLDKLIRDSGGTMIRNQGDLARFAGDALKLKWIQRAGEVIEQGPRLATFRQHLNAGESAQQAAMAGRRATVDFSRSGEAIRQANALSLFLNARVQGGLGLARTVGREDKWPWQAGEGNGSRARLAALATMTAGLYAYNRQYPEYYDIPRYIRDQNAVIMLPGSEKDPNGPGYKKLNYLALPLREASAFTAPLTYALNKLDHEHGSDPRTWQEFAQSEVGNFSPIAGEDVGSGASALVPAPIRTPVELLANRRFFTGLPIVPQGQQDLPPSQQYNERTSDFSKKMSELHPDISPEQLDFIINENLGGFGKTALGATNQLSSWADKARGGPGRSDETPPVIGGLASGVFRTYGGQESADQYDQLSKLMAQHQEPVASAIRSLPEYLSATRDRQDQMVRDGQSTIKQIFSDRVGLQPNTKDYGLPDKYLGVSDPQKEAQIDRALTKYNAYDQDPKNNPKPTSAEMKLALTYEDQVSEKYKLAKQEMDKRNQGIKKVAQQELATAR